MRTETAVHPSHRVTECSCRRHDQQGGLAKIDQQIDSLRKEAALQDVVVLSLASDKLWTAATPLLHCASESYPYECKAASVLMIFSQ